MEARNRTIPQWFERVRTGQLRLPRFQRFEAWGPEAVCGLVEAVLHGLPTGVALILDVDPEREPFVSRPMVGAPAPTDSTANNESRRCGARSRATTSIARTSFGSTTLARTARRCHGSMGRSARSEAGCTINEVVPVGYQGVRRCAAHPIPRRTTS